MSMSTPFLPPAVVPVAPPTYAARPPVAFRSHRSTRSGSRRTVFVGEPAPGVFTFTGEFYRPSVLRGFRAGQVVLSVTAVSCFVAALVAGARAEDGSTPPIIPVLMVLGLAALFAIIAWKGVLRHSIESATVTVNAAELRRVRSTVNYNWLPLWLLIGPFALIPLFAGRRLLRLETPAKIGGLPDSLPLFLLEQHHGDAEQVCMRMRLAGAG